jgi:hypothetical protein
MENIALIEAVLRYEMSGIITKCPGDRVKDDDVQKNKSAQ